MLSWERAMLWLLRIFFLNLVQCQKILLASCGAGTVNLVFLQFAIQRGAPNSEQARGVGAVAVGIVERPFDGAPLHFGKW